jgi:ankyrin repeat protein
MKRLANSLRNAFLSVATIGLFGGLISFNYALQNDPARQAVRYLDGRETPVEPKSAVDAAGEGDLFLLEQLNLAGVDLSLPEPESGLTPLQSALRSDQPKAVDYLLEQEATKASIDAPAASDGRSALAWALGRRDFGIAERLTGLGAQADLDAEPGVPWLARAARDEDWEVFGFLLAKGADPNRPDPSGISPLALSIGRQDGERIQALLKAGAKVDGVGITGDTLLMESIGRGDHDLTERLLIAGASVDGMGASGQTALLSAIKAGSTAMTELLLTNGANPNLAGKDRQTPLALATDARDIDLMQVLIDAGADPKQPELIRTAFRRRDLPSINLLLRSGADPETEIGNGRKLLDLAVEARSTAMTRALLAAGANPEGRLWAALNSGDAVLGEMILSHGASASERGPDGRLPMDFALGGGGGKLVKTLLDRGALPNGRNADGEYWVARAIREGNVEAAETLIDRGACVDGVAAADGHSLLGWAIARRMGGIVERLIAQGADVGAREPAPASEAFTAAFTRSKTFRWHLEVDSKINPLMLAVAQGDRKIAEQLIEAGAKKGESTRRYLWPVNIAAWHADVPMMQTILGRDPDPDNQPRKIIVDLGSQKATLYQDGRATYTTRVSTGKSGYRTPAGTFVITDKNRHHTSSIYHSSMPYFMRLSCAAFGLHQGVVPGYPASHGCIRVPQSGARYLFSICEVGDVVEIRH